MTHRYYSLLRPIGLGTYPKRGAIEIVNYDHRQYVDEIKHEAWGYVTYERELSPSEIENYELSEAK